MLKSLIYLLVLQNDIYPFLLAPPTWLDEVKDLVVPMGFAVTVLCRANGSPPPTVKLKRISGKF